MIKLQVDHKNMELKISGSDEVIMNELSLAVMRLLQALEKNEGNRLEDHLTILIMNLLAHRDACQNLAEENFF